MTFNTSEGEKERHTLTTVTSIEIHFTGEGTRHFSGERKTEKVAREKNASKQRKLKKKKKKKKKGHS